MYLHAGAIVRRVAQRVRHAPGLRSCDPVWRILRAPYGRALRALSSAKGIPLCVGGHTMRLDAGVANLNWETVEPESYRAFAAAIRPGDVVFDVGAHFGTYTLIADAHAGLNGRVVAYEPCPLTRRYLTQHLVWNGAADRVIVRPLCCGATIGTAPFYFKPDTPEGINGLVPRSGLDRMTAAVTTVDAESAELQLTPAVLKIDVEGAELDVLKGAERVLATASPRVFLSLHPRPLATLNLTPGHVINWLAARGYRCDHLAEDQELHVVATR